MHAIWLLPTLVIVIGTGTLGAAAWLLDQSITRLTQRIHAVAKVADAAESRSRMRQSTSELRGFGPR